MGRFESNVLAQRPCHRLPRDSLDQDGRLSGSLAAFKFAISAGFEKNNIRDSFRKAFAPRPILLFQKMRGWLRVRTTIPKAKHAHVVTMAKITQNNQAHTEHSSVRFQPHSTHSVMVFAVDAANVQAIGLVHRPKPTPKSGDAAALIMLIPF